MQKSVIGGGVLAVLLTLAACTPVDSENSASPTPAPDGPMPVVTVTVTAEPAAPSDGPDYGFTFFHDAQMGSTWAQMSTQLNMPVGGIEECPHYGAVWNTELATTYAFTNASSPAGGVSFFYTNRFLATDGAPFPRNAEGVGVGSTQAQVLAAYPTATVGVHEDLGVGLLSIITVDDDDSDSKYVFAFYEGSTTVDLLQWGPGAGTQWSHLCGGF